VGYSTRFYGILRCPLTMDTGIEIPHNIYFLVSEGIYVETECRSNMYTQTSTLTGWIVLRTAGVYPKVSKAITSSLISAELELFIGSLGLA